MILKKYINKIKKYIYIYIFLHRCRISVKGNGTCALSTKMPKSQELLSHADYDVYVRSQRAPHCEPDRLYKIESDSSEQQKRNETKPTTGFGSGLLNPTMPSIPSSPRYDYPIINFKQRTIPPLAFLLFVHISAVR